MNHVQKHGKAITIHLKKHHKKYVFGALSAALLYKGVSIIVAYIIVHNISFSFADSIFDDNNENTIIGIETENKTENKTEAIKGAEIEGGETTSFEDNIINEINEGIDDDTESNNKTEGEELEGIEGEEKKEPEEEIPEEEIPEIEGEKEDESEVVEIIGGEKEENTIDDETDNKDDNNLATNMEGGLCDLGDIDIISPIEGDITGGIITINLKYNNDDCIDNKFLVKLRDQNSQYITLYENSGNLEKFEFDSKLLIRGLYTETGIDDNGNEIVTFSGEYEGNGTNYFTGHIISIVDEDGETVYRGKEFTIDNKEPTISNIIFETINNKYLKIGDTINFYFQSDEDLDISNTKVVIQGTNAIFENKSGNNYKYTLDLSSGNTQGQIIYGIDYSDQYGNTGYYEGLSEYVFDSDNIEVKNIDIEYTGNKLFIDLEFNKEVKINFEYLLSGKAKGNELSGNGKYKYSFEQEFNMTSGDYEYFIEIEDNTSNKKYIKGIFHLRGNKIINDFNEIGKNEMLTNLGFLGEEELSGDLKTGANNTGFDSEKVVKGIRKQFENFNKCKSGLEFKKMELPINKNTAVIYMPEFEKSFVKKLVSSFSITLYNSIEEAGIDQAGINKITNDFNNFLIIVKLTKDDNNQCKQNLTNYYTTKFKSTILKYGLDKE